MRTYEEFCARWKVSRLAAQCGRKRAVEPYIRRNVFLETLFNGKAGIYTCMQEYDLPAAVLGWYEFDEHNEAHAEVKQAIHDRPWLPVLDCIAVMKTRNPDELHRLGFARFRRGRRAPRQGVTNEQAI